jgi:UPF0716 protein FxsA
MLWLFVLILWPVAELAAAVAVASEIGVLLTVVLLLAAIPLGGLVLRAEGRAVMRRLAEALAAGRAPAREVLDGALVLSAGTLLIVPGFITDALGLLLLAPPTRAIARHLIARNLRSRLVARAIWFGAGARPYDVDSTARPYDVDSTAVDADPETLDRTPPRLPA